MTNRYKIRVPVVFVDGAWFPDVPEGVVVPGSFEPLIPDFIHADGVFPGVEPGSPQLVDLTCEVMVPERIVDPATGTLDISKIRALYRGDPVWDNACPSLSAERRRLGEEGDL